jgi:uncharacterized protein (DUF2267 family)
MRPSYMSTMDHTMQVTNEWVHQLDELVPWDDSNKSFRLLRATLQTVRDQLGVEEAAQLAAQLPLFLRGVYYDGWDPSRTPSTLARETGLHRQHCRCHVAGHARRFRGHRQRGAVAAEHPYLGWRNQ